MKNRVTILFVLFITLGFQINSNAQSGMSLNSPESLDGYTLFAENRDAYLIDNCGGVVNEWFVGFTINHPKIQPNGNLLYLVSDGIIEKDWDDNLISYAQHGDSQLRLKYEVEILPNGNYLSVGRRSFSTAQFMEIGYNLSGVSPSEMDVVVELDRETGEILWEWKIVEHVIQQRDSLLPNYGVLSENSQLLNMDAVSRYDWLNQESFMINGMDYNPELDQIILSVRKMSEIVIIDHSTTAEEVSGHTGGRYGKGGDILYRWGNPQNYGIGSAADRILYFQHNPNWITEGELKGQIICYNNGLNRPGFGYFNNYSTVPIIDPPMDADGNYIKEDSLVFLPLEAPIEYSEVHTNTSFYSSYTSGAQYLPNGNIFITEGVDGRILEVDSTGELVWSYTVPAASYLFRSERYSRDYIGFEGQDMTPDGKVPLDFSAYDCTLYGISSAQSASVISDAFDITFNQNDNELNVLNTLGNSFDLTIYNLQGQALIGQNADVQTQMNLRHLPKGMYVLRLDDSVTNTGITKKIITQ